MNGSGKFIGDLIKILSQAVEKRVYGSVEVYFEAGRITQVTQRIINKIHHQPKVLPRGNDPSEVKRVKMPS